MPRRTGVGRPGFVGRNPGSLGVRRGPAGCAVGGRPAARLGRPTGRRAGRAGRGALGRAVRHPVRAAAGPARRDCAGCRTGPVLAARPGCAAPARMTLPSAVRTGPVPSFLVTVLALGPEWLQPDTIIAWLGPWAVVGLAAIVFAECGLLLGLLPARRLAAVHRRPVRGQRGDRRAAVGGLRGAGRGRLRRQRLRLLHRPGGRAGDLRQAAVAAVQPGARDARPRSSSTSTATGRSCSAGSCRSCAPSSR